MDSRFLEAWIYRKDHKAFGLRLYPFCAYHLLYLYAMDNPFSRLIRGDTEKEDFAFKPEDLVQAVWICSQRPGFALEDVVPDTLLTAFRLRCFTWKLVLYDFDAQFTRFYQYLCDYITVPEVWEADGAEERKTLSAPWLLSRVAALSMETGKDEDALWRLPLGKLLWYSLTIAELQGLTEFISPEEQEMIEEMRRQQMEAAESETGTL